MLIFTRRLLAILLLPGFLLLFLATVITFRANSTLLEPSFYTDELERFAVYDFLYDGLLVTLEKVELANRADEKEGFVLEKDVSLNLGLTHDSVVDYARRIIPPSWIAQNITMVIDAAARYLTGETDSFAVQIRIDDRVEEASDVARELIQQADIYGFIVDEIIIPEVDEKGVLDSLPFGVKLTKDELTTGMKEVASEAWLKEQLDGALEEIIPYLIGREETFTVSVDLQERASAGLVMAERWMLSNLESDLSEYLLEEQITPTVQTDLGAFVALPYGVTVTSMEIVDAISEALPQKWRMERLSEAVQQVGPYLIGETDSFTLVISLEERAEAASATLVAAMDVKFQAIYEGLALCTVQDLLVLDLTLAEVPVCRPPAVSYRELKKLLGLDVPEQLIQAIVDPLPSTIVITPDELFSRLDPSASSLLAIRERVIGGATFTEQDLRRLIVDQSDASVLETFDEVRGYLKNGFSLNDDQVKEKLIKRGRDVQAFDDVRGWINIGFGLQLVLIIALVMIAAIIGFLGGQSWSGRAIWSGVPLLFCGLIIAVCLGGISRAAGDFAEDVIRDLDSDNQIEMLIPKLLEVSDGLVTSFVNPMVIQAVAVALIGLGMIVGGVVLRRRRSDLVFDHGWVPPSLDDEEEQLVEGDWPSSR